MKAADRKRALKAARLQHRGVMLHAIARRLKVDQPRAQVIMNVGLAIEQCEAHRLTDNEMLVMKTLARVEARRVALGEAVAKSNHVDFAAGKRSGWTYSVVKKRLFGGELPFVIYTPNGHVWLTAPGWAFVWATGLILKNWKVPA
jgi:hypothetical protein